MPRIQQGVCPPMTCSPRLSLRFLLLSLTLVVLSGCGTQPSVVKSDGNDAAAETKKSASAKKSGKKSAAKVTEQDGRKYLDGIPYDVWFDDPLAVVADSSAVATPDPAATTPDPKSAPPDTPAKPDTPAASDAGDWASYIAAEQLQEESKRLRNQLKTLLQTPAAYTSDFEVVKMDGAVLSTLAVIVLEAGDGVNWKPNAGYIRDYGLEIFEAAKGPGKPNYDKTNAAFENLQSVFSGSIPAGAAEPAAQRPLAEVASRYYVMRRMKLAFEALKLNINTDAKLKSEQEQALHEIMILAAMSKAVSTKEYSSADEPEYQAFMKEILEKCQAAAAAAKDQQFDAFSEALNAIDITCKNCHSQYKD